MKTSTKKLTVSAMLSALCCAIMLVGSIIDVMDLSTAAIASFAVTFAILELGSAYPTLIFSSVSLLGMLLLPSKLPAVYFILFFGWYPIVKFPLEKLRSWLSWLLKCAICSLSVTVILLVSVFFAGAEDLITLNAWVYLVCVPVFVLYDVALTRVTRTYLRFWKQKYRIDLSK